jgi:hypothetical protein
MICEKTQAKSSRVWKQIKTNYETCDRRLKMLSNGSLKAENNLTQYPWI